MAHANGKIYRDASTNPPYGIDARGDVAVVLQRSTGDWGQLCGDVDKNGADVNKVNIHSVHKPVRSPLKGGTEQEIKVPAKYGFRIDTKAAGSSTLSFIQQLRSQGAGYAHWGWNKPRGLVTYAEDYRIDDFDGYRHGQLPYRTPAFLTRLTASQISINGGQPLSVEIARRSTKTEVLTSTPFVLNDAYDVTVLVTIEDPNPESAASYMNWDVDGDFQINLVDANGRVVDSDYQTGFGIQTGNLPQTISLHFEGWHSLQGYTAPFRIQYRLHMANDTYYNNGSSDVYVPVTLKIDTVYAATLTMSKTGQDGVVVRPGGMEAEWRENGYRAREAVFGANASWPIVVVEVYNGSTTQRKICLVPSSGFISFQRIGITIQPRQATNAKDLIVYLLYGNYQQIFPDMQRQVDYGDLSLADSYVLTCAPNCYNELGILPDDPEPMIVHQDDFYSGTMTWTDDTTTELHAPNQTGFVTSDKGIKVFSLTWGFYIENVPVAMPVTVTMDVYNGDDELVETVVREYIATVGDWSVLANLVADGAIAGYIVDEVYVKINIEANGDVYYLNILNQTLSKTDPGAFYIGTNPS